MIYLDCILKNINPPTGDPEKKLQFQATTLDYNDYDSLTAKMGQFEVQEESLFSIIMQKEDDGLWYIDPSSLINYENAEQELLPVQTGEPAQNIPEESSEKPEDTAKSENGGSNTIILVAEAALLIGGGAFYYFKIYKKKPKQPKAPQYDEDEDDAEEETVNEDSPDVQETEDSE